MIKLVKFSLVLIYLISIGVSVLAAPRGDKQGKAGEDYEDEDDLIDLFLSGLKADVASSQNASSSSSQDSSNPPKLILISFDGFRWDYLDNHTLPNITKYFVEQGVKVNGGLKNVFPTYTFPNLWSLATGLYPESHGIVSNEFYDPKLNADVRNVSGLELVNEIYNQNNLSIPIWILNQLNTSSERRSANLGGYPGANVVIKNTSVAYSEFHLDNDHDDSNNNWFKRIDRLVELLTAEQSRKINLGVLYFLEPDTTGHKYGPYSPEIQSTLLKCDSLVGYLIQRLNQTNLLNNTNIILTSDHGMESVSDKKIIELHKYVNIEHITTLGRYSQLNMHSRNETELNQIYEALKNVPHLNVYKKDQVPDHLNYRDNVRIGDLVLYADAGYEIYQQQQQQQEGEQQQRSINSTKSSNNQSDHGYDTSNASMRPVFVARGPSFRLNHTVNSTVNLVDIYPLMCHLLDLTPGPNNGSFDRVQEMLNESSNDVQRHQSQQKQQQQLSISSSSLSMDAAPTLMVLNLLSNNGSNHNNTSNNNNNNKTNASISGGDSNKSVIRVILNITQNSSREDKGLRDMLEMFGVYPGHFKFVNLLPLIILIMIVVTFICLCKMEMSKEREPMGFSYTPLDNNCIYTRDILPNKQ